ncbi:hypothetical protein E2I00_017195, partial [Balaenoptera physalus]
SPDAMAKEDGKFEEEAEAEGKARKPFELFINHSVDLIATSHCVCTCTSSCLNNTRCTNTTTKAFS